MAKTFDLSILFKIIDQATGPLRRIGERFRGLTEKVKRFGARMRKVGKDMARIGKSMTMRMTLPIVGLGAAAIHTASSFQKSMNMVKGITNATGKEFKELEGLALLLGKTTVFSARDAADAMKFLARTGMDTKTIMGALPTVLKLAAAGQMDLATSADIVTNIMKGYGAEISELPDMSDILAKTFTSANVDLTMLGETFKYAGSIAKVAGMDFKEFAAIVGSMGDAQIQGSLAGTTMRQAIIRLHKPSKKAIDIMAGLGIKIYTSTGKMRSMIAILKDLSKKQIGLGEAAEIFGVRAVTGMVKIMDGGIPALEALREKMNDAKGTADRLEKVTMEGLPGAIAKLKAAIETVLISFTKEGGLGDVFIRFSERVVRLMDTFAKLSPETKKWVTIGLAVAAALGPVVMLLGFMAQGIGAIIAIGPALAAMGFTLATFAVSAALVLATVGLLATAAYLLIKNWKEVKIFFTDFWVNINFEVERFIKLLKKIPIIRSIGKPISAPTTPEGYGDVGRMGAGIAMGRQDTEHKVTIEVKGRDGAEGKVTGVQRTKGDADLDVISDVYSGLYMSGMGG